VRFLYAFTSQGNSQQVIEAEKGKSALYAMRERHPDLVILDIGLPDMDGYEVTSQVRQWSNVPIIILSVRNREAEKIKALNAVADDYLTKPFGVGELLARIQVVMRRVGNTGSQFIRFEIWKWIVCADRLSCGELEWILLRPSSTFLAF
jgi:two-component system KDP operon response regulator KdpE